MVLTGWRRPPGLQGRNESRVSAPRSGVGVRLDFQCWSATRDFSSSFNLALTVERTERFVFLTVADLKKVLCFHATCFCNIHAADTSGNSRPGVVWPVKDTVKRPFSGPKLECSIFSPPVLPSTNQIISLVTCQPVSNRPPLCPKT